MQSLIVVSFIVTVVVLLLIIAHLNDRRKFYRTAWLSVKQLEHFRTMIGGPMDGKEVICNAKRVIVPMRVPGEKTFGRCMYEQDENDPTKLTYVEANND